ncbi:hypothetical protein CR513_62108, partial [Mucuna pruriens]
MSQTFARTTSEPGTKAKGKEVASPKDKALIKEIIVDVTNKGKDILTPEKSKLDPREEVKLIILSNGKEIAPQKDKALIKEIIVDITSKGKDVLTPEKCNKKKLDGVKVVNLTKECSTVVLKKFPHKLKDSRCFTISCTMGNSYSEKALCDLGASINLLANRSITHPLIIAKDVWVKVGEFIFPTSFVILNMEEEDEVPIILG